VTPDDRGERILVHAPTGRDGLMVVAVLERAGLSAEVVRDLDELTQRLAEGAGAAFLAEEALSPQVLPHLVEALVGQPPWSDFPLVIMTSGGKATRQSTTISQALGPSGNVTLLERPLRALTLVSAMQAALRARRRQYEVRRLLQEAQQGVQRRDQFLAMLAHELRNPLAPIRNAVHVFKLIGPADANLSWARDVIDRQVEHLTRIVDDLLDISRITEGKIRLQKEVIDVSAVVARAVETSRPLIDARRQQLEVSFPPSPVRLEADPTRMAQVLANLLNNASKYTDEGGKLWLAAGREGNEVVFRVRDTGMGIPAELLPRVFDLFAQGDRSLARSEGGLGIGLTLVRGLVELHGGRVEAFSAGLGNGSEFVVRLPVPAGPALLSNGREEAQRVERQAGKRILVVDDNVDAAESLALLLRLAGHEVWTTHDGPAALGLARELRPEVVLLDIGLPGMDGYEVARRLRQEPGLSGALLVAVSGYGQAEDRRRSREAGFDEHVVKPADPTEVGRILAGARRSP
jgi:signal transduction histidine kinase/CheY-like chemotaxis protein